MKQVWMWVFVALTAIGTGCSEAPGPPSEAPGQAEAEAAPVVATADPPAGTADAYPIDFCVVSGEKLGSMGDPAEVTVEGRLVKLCCAACEAPLRSDPARYLALLDAPPAGGASHVPGDGGAHHGGHGHQH